MLLPVALEIGSRLCYAKSLIAFDCDICWEDSYQAGPQVLLSPLRGEGRKNDLLVLFAEMGLPVLEVEARRQTGVAQRV